MVSFKLQRFSFTFREFYIQNYTDNFFLLFLAFTKMSTQQKKNIIAKQICQENEQIRYSEYQIIIQHDFVDVWSCSWCCVDLCCEQPSWSMDSSKALLGSRDTCRSPQLWVSSRLLPSHVDICVTTILPKKKLHILPSENTQGT